MKDSELLRHVRRKIESGVPFICWGIDQVYATKSQKAALTAWVMEMLQGCFTYSEWVETYHPAVYRTRNANSPMLLQGRLAWLDWMIAYCEKEEQEHEKQTRSTGQVADPGPAAG